MLPIRRAVENTLVAYLQQMAEAYPQCAALTQGMGWKVQPNENVPGTSTPVPRPIVPGRRAGMLPKPCNLVVACVSADADLSSAGIFCVTVKFTMLDAGTDEGLAAQEKTTLALQACLPLLELGGANMALAVDAINGVQNAECVVSSFAPAKPYDAQGSEDRHFASYLAYEFYVSSQPDYSAA